MRTCTRCHRPTVPTRWTKPIPTGAARYKAGGLCSSCYRCAHRIRVTSSHGTPGRPRLDDAPDWVAAERALQGEALRLTPASMRLAVQMGTRRGRSIADLARTLGCSETTVSRHRAALRDQVAA